MYEFEIRNKLTGETAFCLVIAGTTLSAATLT